MITREILEVQRAQYVKGHAEAAARLNEFNGGIEALDNLLRILDQRDALVAQQEESAQEGNTNA